MHGDVDEVTSVFEACLQVGSIHRASTILTRINKTEGIDPYALLNLHNQFLRAAVEQIVITHTDSELPDLHKWFELEIRKKGIPQDIETLAYMVKASLHTEEKRQERLVRRYMDMLDENAAFELLETGILTAREVNHINHIYPKYNFATDLDQDLDIEPEYIEEEMITHEKLGAHEATPEVRATPQKGLGLKSLKRALSLFSTLPDQANHTTGATKETKRDLQKRLEEDAVEAAVDRWRQEHVQLQKMGFDGKLQTKSLGARMWQWQKSFEDELRKEVSRVNASEIAENKTDLDKERCFYGPFLRLLPPEKLAAVTILGFMSKLCAIGTQKGIPLSTAIMAIANSAEDEVAYAKLKKSSKKSVWTRSFKELKQIEHMKHMSRIKGPGSSARFAATHVLNSQGQSSHRPWSVGLKAKIGAYLMSALIEVSTVPATMADPKNGETLTQIQPAFSHSIQVKAGKRLGVVIANKHLVAQIMREPVHSLMAKHLPMLVEPDPWTKFDKGGYVAHPSKMMRVKSGSKDQRNYIEAAIGQGSMDQVFKGLDILGKTAWRINQPLFHIMLDAWNSGEAIANLAPEKPKLVIPPEPEARDPIERGRWIRAVKVAENHRIGYHSQRCFQNFQLEIARALRNEEFFFPHNMDFRGRAYPIPPYLNHMGADHCRGLLMFGKGKELGEEGLRWLKIHLANVYGFDKASLSEREAFTDKHLENIRDSATNPLNGKKWWLEAEDSWQCLAACLELTSALNSPEPTKYISHLPVHQDGTCNGLQHYAALGGDVWGAKQVNLEPGDRPADVYSAVAQLVKESIAKDKEKADPFALILDGKITRKIVKQTVMTNVYGVTYIGAKAQVKKQLVAADLNLPNNPTLNPDVLAAYITTKIFTALSNMFRGAHDIQYWLGECARRISTSLTPEQVTRLEMESKMPTPKKKTRSKKSADEELVQFKTTVTWTSPLNMPVCQPYRATKSTEFRTTMQDLSLRDPHRSDPVSKRKQLQGFPPNFIHSLDATHMLLSALECDERGLSFAAVHDSFWTHACDIGTMNTVLRDAFIRIHEDDVVGRLCAEFEARHRGAFYLASIKKRSPLYQKVINWRKGRKIVKTTNAVLPQKARLDELLLEQERSRLLASDKLDEVEKGKSMVTPASLFEEFSAETDLAGTEDLKGLGLGDMSPRQLRLSADQEIQVGDSSNVGEIGNPLPGGAQLDASLGSDVVDGHEAEAEFEQEVEQKENETELSSFEKSLKKKTTSVEQALLIWLPLTFPPVPKKVSSPSRNLIDRSLIIF